MRRPPTAALALLAALAAFFVFRDANASEVDSRENPQFPPNPVPSFGDDVLPLNDPVPSFGDDALPLNDLSLAAFLFMIRNAEHTRENAINGNAYGIFYGGSFFTNFADHPVLTGEKVGVPLSDAMCANANMGPGCVSTAAGAYQINKPTWRTVRKAGAWGDRLPDFGPESQDEAARRILMLDGALPLIEQGDIIGAILKAGKSWASLPGSTAKQGGKTIQQAQNFYSEGLQVLA